jgi:DNA modification methylase
VNRTSTAHRLFISDCLRVLPTLPTGSIALVVTSPPYFNAEHDYKGYYRSYDEYKELLHRVARESIRVLDEGRVFALNIDDMRVDGRLYPIVADATEAFLDAGFNYRARITWVKPNGYVLKQRQSAVAIQHPYPMYPRFSNLTESILLFQKRNFDYSSVSDKIKEESRIDIDKWKLEWHFNVWHFSNVVFVKGKLEEGIAAFPDELPRRLITLFSYRGETILDMFAGSGTSTKVARQLGRNSISIEILPELEEVIRQKAGFQHRNQEQTDIFAVVPSKHSPKRIILPSNQTPLAVARRFASVARPS